MFRRVFRPVRFPQLNPFLCQGSFYPQGELERRSPGRLRLWVQAPLRHPAGRSLCRDSSGMHCSSASIPRCKAFLIHHLSKGSCMQTWCGNWAGSAGFLSHEFLPTTPDSVNLDLASHCRLLFHNRAKHTTFWRWFILYPLYVISEIAIISTDLAELLGSAIALNLLFPKLPLWAGVLLTAFDVLFILAFSDPLHGRPVRSFELIIGILVRTFIMAYTITHISLRYWQC